MIITKYDIFFKQLMDFSIRSGLAGADCFVGSSNIEIEEFGEERGFQFGSGWNSYLSFFAKKLAMKNLDLYFGFEMIRNAERQHSEIIDRSLKIGYDRNWILQIQNIISQSNDDILTNNKEKSLFIIRSSMGAIYFSFPEDSEMIFFIFSEDENEISQPMTICTAFRINFFVFYFRLLCDVEKIEMAPWYNYIKVVKEKFPNKHIPRAKFCFSTQEKELKSGHFLGIDEFEVEFIKHLIEEKITDPMPEIFDPYAPIVTFNQYLRN